MPHHIAITLLEVTKHLLNLAVLPLEGSILSLRLLQHVLVIVSLFADVCELPLRLLELFTDSFSLIARCLVLNKLKLDKHH